MPLRPLASLVMALALMAGCASHPPGSSFPKTPSTALADPEETPLGRQFADASRAHGGNSGFRIIPVGADGFLVRMQMIDAARRTIDLQYFIFRGDETGHLLTDAVLRAADRGVRVRILLDDGETVPGDEQITALASHGSVHLRIFNPFAYRGHNSLLRATEFTLHSSRLDYRMHNKLLVVDDAVALMGGRNVGDEYFQIDPESQYADDDVFSAGPIVQRLSATFDEFWNSDLSIPAEALSKSRSSRAALEEHREEAAEKGKAVEVAGVDYARRVAAGEPFAGIVTGRLALEWAHAELVYDSPDKKKVQDGDKAGRLLAGPVIDAARAAQSEFLMVTPYLIPGDEGMRLFEELRDRGVRVRILTNSLESANMLAAHTGYMHFRVPLLERGVELHEIRSRLGNPSGSGQTAEISRYGNYSLHAKLFVFDRRRLFVGSMNFDQRSMHLNTEIGLIIDSPVLAEQVAGRFERMVQPANAYRPFLQARGSGKPDIAWETLENGKEVELHEEPARSGWQRASAKMISLLHLDREL